MTRGTSLAGESRISYAELVGDGMEKLFLRAHEMSLADDSALASAVESWLRSKQYEHLDSELDSIASHCQRLRVAIESVLVELQDARTRLVESVSCENSQSAYVDEHDDTEAPVDHEMMNLFGNVTNDTGAVLSMTIGEDASRNKSRTSMVKFILGMARSNSVSGFTSTQVQQILNKCEAMLRELPSKVQTDTIWVRDSLKAGEDAVDTINEVVAAFIYSVDAKDCACATVKECLQRQLEDSVDPTGRKHRRDPRPPQNSVALGWNGNHWAMMNWSYRVAADGNAWERANDEVETEVRNAVEFFRPLRETLNSGLKVFPKRPRVVFRGVNVPVAHKYTLGTQVSFAPFTSTSLVGEEALKFVRQGGTYFVISTHSGAMISDFSHYPEQAEALLATNTEFVVTSKMSRTLQQMLGNDFDVVFMAKKDQH